MIKTLLAILVLSVCSFGQDAVVVELPKSAALEARQVYEAKIAADKAWDQLYGYLKNQYFPGEEFVFSKDFRFIVPKPYTPPMYSWPTNCSWGGLLLTTATTSNPCPSIQYLQTTPTFTMTGATSAL